MNTIQDLIKLIIDNKYTSKKFIVALSMIGCATFLGLQKDAVGVSLLSGENIAIIFGLVGAGYGIANVANKKPEDIDPNAADVLSRKFIIAMIIIACTTILATCNVMSGNSVMTAIGISGGMYGFTNAREKAKGQKTIQ